MALEIKVPTVGESISEVTVSKWLKQDGDYVEMDEVLAELESDKATFELNAEVAGILKTMAKEGDTVKVGSVICSIDEKAAPASAKTKVDEKPAAREAAAKSPAVAEAKSGEPAIAEAKAGEPATKKVSADTKADETAVANKSKSGEKTYASGTPSPAAQKILAEKDIQLAAVQGSGRDGRITKEDALKSEKSSSNGTGHSENGSSSFKGGRNARREKMSNLRKTISRRLVAVKNETAMLTTFNEVDMKPIMDIRAKYKDKFKEKHGVGLGFMSFFTKAVCEALKAFPAVNAMIDGEEIVYNEFCDISIAVSGPKGLVVPVIRNAESLSLDQIEKEVLNLAGKARENKLSIEEMTGGTFTITNGGVFGSLMSTPIINAPQSAILGMHNIVERPVAINGEVVIRPMMYVALSYDHRIIDGRESVSFLVRVKQLLENPGQLLSGKDPVIALLGI